MKRNAFGEVKLQPGDDLQATWNDEFGTDEPEIGAFDLSREPGMGWTCCLMDADANEREAHDFESEEALRSWLTEQGATIQE